MICNTSLILKLWCDLAESNTLKYPSPQTLVHKVELFRCLKMYEVLSLIRCSRTPLDKCQDVSPILAGLHPAQVNLYTTKEQSDVGTQSLTEIKLLALKDENANLMLRFSQYFLASIRSSRWVKLELERNGNLNFIVETSLGDVKVFEF